LEFLKKESIKRSGKIFIGDLFGGSPESFNNLNPQEFFSKSYDLRSKLVHEGKHATKHLTVDNAQMQEFASSCLRKYFKKYCHTEKKV